MKNRRTKDPLTFTYWQYQLVGWSIFLINELGSSWSYLTLSDSLLTRLSFTYVSLFALISLLRIFYRRIYSKLQKPAYYLIVSALSSGIVSFLWMSTRVLFDVYVLEIETNWPKSEFNSDLFTPVLLGAWPSFVWSILYFGIKYWQDLISERERAQSAVVQAQKAQLQMLRYQLNPHFLFNSLNSIQALVHENPDQADEMVAELSEFLRSTLKYNDRINIPVKEEMEITARYLAIEKVRYEERLAYTFRIDPNTNDLDIPCFITQPLVENAVKHGLLNNPSGITLVISASMDQHRLILEISNSGKLRQDWEPGIGLRNIFERLKNSFPDQYVFSLTEKGGIVVSRIEISIK